MRQIYLAEPTRTDLFIFAFKSWSLLFLLDKSSHIFGARNVLDSAPYLTDLTLCLSKNLFQEGHKCNTLFRSGVESPCTTLYVSIAKTFIFLWCIATELTLLSSSLNDDGL